MVPRVPRSEIQAICASADTSRSQESPSYPPVWAGRAGRRPTKARKQRKQAMVKQHSGVIMGITAVVSQIPFPYTAGFGPAWAAVEAMLRLLAAELGTHGVRTICLHSAGSEGAADKTLTSSTNPEMGKRFEGWGQRWASRNLLGKAPTLVEVGNMAVFMASDLAGATTGTTVSLNDGMINH